MSEHPAGWHPDPRGRHEYRYWDGTAWTDHVANAGQASTDPVDVVGPAATAGAQPAAAEPAEPVVEPEPRDRAPEPTRGSAALPPEHGTTGPEAAVGEPQPEIGGPDGAGLWSGGPVPAPADEPQPSPTTAAGARAEEVRAEDVRSPDAAPSDAPPRTGPSATEALRSATATKSPALAGLLTLVAPGSGHFYLGAGPKTGLAAGLLVATLAAYVLAWFSFTTFVIGFVVWVVAAGVGVLDLQGVLKPIREAGAAASSVSPAQVGLVLVAGGVLLVLALFLPWYHVSIDFKGPSTLGFGGFGGSSGSVSGFGATSVVDIVLVVVAIGVIVLGLAALGVGPLVGRRLPPWLPAATAAAGAVALVLVAYRMAIDPFPGGANFGLGARADVSVGRGFGLLLDGAAALAIAAAGLVTLAQAPRTT